MSYKAVRFASTGNLAKVLKVESLPIPKPNPEKTALIRIRAAAINPADTKNIQGFFPNTTLPRTPGRDFAGIVESGPAEWVGKRVWGTGGVSGITVDGSHAQFFEVDKDCLLEIPKVLEFEQAAACGVGFLTAASMIKSADVKEGEYVLVLGSSGAVGSAAVQIIESMGAKPILSSRRSAPGAVDTTAAPETFLEQTRELTGGKGLNAVLDTVGDPGLFSKAQESLGLNGRYVLIAMKPGPDGSPPEFKFNPLNFYRNNRSFHGVNTFTISLKDAVGMLKELGSGFESGKLVPPKEITSVDINDEKAVLEAFETVNKGARGKYVLANKK